MTVHMIRKRSEAPVAGMKVPIPASKSPAAVMRVFLSYHCARDSAEMRRTVEFSFAAGNMTAERRIRKQWYMVVARGALAGAAEEAEEGCVAAN